MAKNSDIRLAMGWHHHPKILMLGRKLGDSAVLSLVKLWTFAGDSKPNGILSDMDETYIEIAAEWAGEEGAFTLALFKLRLLDRDDYGTYSIHDWYGNNPYAAGSEGRSKAGRDNVNERWRKHREAMQSASKVYEPYTNGIESIQSVIPNDTKPQNANTPTNQPTNQPTNINISKEICTKKPKVQKQDPSPLLPDCEYFRATDHELETAKATWIKNGNDEADFRLAIAEVEFWLGTESPKAKAARRANSHARQLHAAWVVENISRKHEAHRKKQGRIFPQQHQLTGRERRHADLMQLIAETEPENEQPLNVTPRIL